MPSTLLKIGFKFEKKETRRLVILNFVKNDSQICKATNCKTKHSENVYF